MNLIEIQQERLKVQADIKTLTEEFKKTLKQKEQAVTSLDKQEQLLLNDINTDSVSLARTVISVSGRLSEVRHGQYPDQRRNNIRQIAVDEAVEDLATGLVKIRKGYFGVKNYSGFGDQGCDCEYGMGPTHGSIVFSVGLNRERRKDEFTDSEIEASIYYLKNLNKIQEAELKAA
jgi:hypothetical protein